MHSLLFYQCTAHWLLLYYVIIILLFYAIADFYSFYEGAVEMQICAFMTRGGFRVSDSHVTVKACGPLVLKYSCQTYECIYVFILTTPELFWFVWWDFVLLHSISPKQTNNLPELVEAKIGWLFNYILSCSVHHL